MSFISQAIQQHNCNPDWFHSVIYPPPKERQLDDVKDYQKLRLFDPLHDNPNLECPIHQQPLSQTNDWSQRNPRLLYDLCGNISLVSKLYKCSQCTNNWIAHSPRIVDQMASQAPFFLVHKSGFSRECVEFTCHSMEIGKRTFSVSIVVIRK